jgi:hypothetical protein
MCVFAALKVCQVLDAGVAAPTAFVAAVYALGAFFRAMICALICAARRAEVTSWVTGGVYGWR